MAHIRDFEQILPDPQPYVEKALALYERAVRKKRGRIVFIAAELGGGKTDLLNALAQALHDATPEPNFVAGFFRGGEYHRHTFDWQEKICLKKAVLAVGETAALLGFFPGLYAFAASFIGQLLQTSASAHEFGNEFKKHPSPGKESADWLRKLLRRAAEERPLVCLLDDWNEAKRFYWDDMLLSSSREIARDMPLLLFLTVKEPINFAAPEKDESGLTMVIKTLAEKGLAEWWTLPKLSPNEVANSIGPAAPGIVAKLHGVTGGNARWIRELWRAWRLNEIVVMNEADNWIWGPQHKATINLYDDILSDRLARLLNAETAMGVEEVREVLACGALEGVRFTADAVSLALGWDRDDLIDFLDQSLVLSAENPDGLLLEEDNVRITKLNGETSTLWRYRFVSDLHWLALERYGFANEERPDRSDSERLEKTAALAKALMEIYAPEERLAAAPLARLLREIGDTEAAQHYERMTDYWANSDATQEHALYLLLVNKDDWDACRCCIAAEFLIRAGEAMLDAFSYNETLAVLEEATKLAHRAQSAHAEGHASYLCGFILWCEGNDKAARNYANDSLDICRRLREKVGIANSLDLLAKIDFAEGRSDDARRHATESLETYEEISKRSGTSCSLHQLAEIDYAEGHYDEARRHASRSLQIDKEIGNREGTADSMHMLAKIDYAEGCYENARRHATQSLEIDQKFGNRSGTASALHQLAEIEYAEGNYDSARRKATQSLEIHQNIGNRNWTAALLLLAEIDYADSRFTDACKHATHLLNTHREIGNRKGMVSSLEQLARISFANGAYDDARSQASQSLEICQSIGDKHMTAKPLRRLAEVNSVQGRYEDAFRQATEALEICQESGCRKGTAASLRVLGGIARKLMRPIEAFDLINLGALTFADFSHGEVQRRQSELSNLVAAENYGAQQLAEMNQLVLDAYQKDSGKELIETALARLRETDR